LHLRLVCCAIGLCLFAACAELNQIASLVQAPRFEQAPDRQAEIRAMGPGGGLPLGGAGVRLWTKVSNPNAFSLTLGTLKGTLFLEDSQAADVDFPLGLPLAARADTVVPIDVTVSFSNLPGLADSIRRAISRQPIPYRLDGTIGVDAGRLGQPVFGPMTLLRGDVRPPGFLEARIATRIATRPPARKGPAYDYVAAMISGR
jgi:Late embryogenesis abundant protein